MQQDHLSRQPFIDLLKNIIANQSANSKGYSIAIDGEWGSGKTWVLNELESQLDKKYLVFHYNAWENDYYEEPLVAILSVMIGKINEISKQKSVYESAVDELLKEAGKDLKLLLCGITKEITKIDIEKSINSKNGLIERIKKGTEIPDDINSMLPMQNALNTVRENIKKLSEKFSVILIIDELDRCLPEYAIKVLERLHHICNEMPVFQIIAIDKKQLADGISKVYGKVHTNKQGDTEQHILQFADNYLQKFIDVSIPLPNGENTTELSILNGLEKYFEPYIRPTNFNQELVVFDEKFLLNFIKTLFGGIDKRTMEKVLSLVRICHELTLASGAKMEEYLYPHLVYEVLYTIQVYCFHQKDDLKIKKYSDGSFDAFRLIFFDKFDLVRNPYLSKYKLFNSNLAQLTECFLSGEEYENSFDFEVINTITYFMKFFAPRKLSFLDQLQNEFNEWISDDIKFLAVYKSIVLQLVYSY